MKEVERTRTHHDTAINERKRADEDCTHALDRLRQVLGVPGLVDAAIDSPAASSTADAGIDDRPSADTATIEPIPGDAQRSPNARADVHETTRGVAVVTFPTVEETPAGARHLAEAIRAQIPKADDPKITAEGVRQSIRRRRDALGAGWDAEDRQPDERLPLHIEVTGSLAQQTPLAVSWVSSDSTAEDGSVAPRLLLSLVADSLQIIPGTWFTHFGIWGAPRCPGKSVNRWMNACAS